MAGVLRSRRADHTFPHMSSVMQELLAQSSFDKLKEGAIVPGTITEIRQNEVVVDIGGKSEGVIPANEFIDIGDLQIGSTIEVLVEKLEDRNGSPILSFDKAEQKKNWDNILTKFPEGSVATGRVKAKVKGGLIVSIGVDAFMPASHIDVQPPKNLDQYVGQTYDFKVLKINLERKNIVLSRRELIEQQRTDKRRALLDSIQPGQFRKGVVKNITDFGAFIDLDGMDGLLHITDMSWGRISHPSEMLKQGEEVEVMIIEVNREKERVSLGLKQTTKNPWDEIDRKFPVGRQGARQGGQPRALRRVRRDRARRRGSRAHHRDVLDQAHHQALRDAQGRPGTRCGRPRHPEGGAEDLPRPAPAGAEPVGHGPPQLPDRRPRARQGPEYDHLRRLHRTRGRHRRNGARLGHELDPQGQSSPPKS